MPAKVLRGKLYRQDKIASEVSLHTIHLLCLEDSIFLKNLFAEILVQEEQPTNTWFVCREVKFDPKKAVIVESKEFL